MKTRRLTHTVLTVVAVIALVVLAFSSTVLADNDNENAPRIAPPHSKAYGKTLTEWLTIYWRWMFEGGEDKVGRVQLLPLPAGEYAGGTGTEEDPIVFAGELEITLEPGTPFVLPLFAWIGERYEGYPGVPDDEPIPDYELIALIHPNLTIDGRTAISDENKAAFYIGPTWFDPPIEYPEPSEYGSIAAIWFQGFGIVSPPLSVGQHVMHLWEPFTVPGYPYLAYDNTWIVTVAP